MGYPFSVVLVGKVKSYVLKLQRKFNCHKEVFLVRKGLSYRKCNKAFN